MCSDLLNMVRFITNIFMEIKRVFLLLESMTSIE